MEDFSHLDSELRHLRNGFKKLGIHFCDKRTQSQNSYLSLIRCNCDSAAYHLDKAIADAIELARTQKHLKKRLPKATRDALQADLMKRAIGIYDEVAIAQQWMDLTLRNPVVAATSNLPIVTDAIADLTSLQSRLLAIGSHQKLMVQLRLSEQKADVLSDPSNS